MKDSCRLNPCAVRTAVPRFQAGFETTSWPAIGNEVDFAALGDEVAHHRGDGADG